jgi:hypothetical protein
VAYLNLGIDAFAVGRPVAFTWRTAEELAEGAGG